MRFWIIMGLLVLFLSSSFGDRTMDKLAAQFSADIETAAGDEAFNDAELAQQCAGDADCLLKVSP